MSGVLDVVDQRTRLAGQNRLELLLFHLNGRQKFGINVFKIKEVIQCPPLNQLPEAHHVVRGVANMRGMTIPILDLSAAIGRLPLKDTGESNVIVSEFNRKVQGFLVGGVDRIVNLNWEDIHPPPRSAGKDHYLTAVTEVDDSLVEIIDVEKVLSEVIGETTLVSSDVLGEHDADKASAKRIMVADDSSVARKQICNTLHQVGLETIVVNDGHEAFEKLMEMLKQGPIEEQIGLLISDVEMPEMDGYTLTTNIRKTPGLEGLHVILHTSLSGGFNESMVKNVGANQFISKFSADDLANAVLEKLAEDED